MSASAIDWPTCCLSVLDQTSRCSRKMTAGPGAFCNEHRAEYLGGPGYLLCGEGGVRVVVDKDPETKTLREVRVWKDGCQALATDGPGLWCDAHRRQYVGT